MPGSEVKDPEVPVFMIDITPARVRSQQLEDRRFRHPDELVSYMGAMQAQDYPGAKWSVGIRLPGCTDAEVEEAIARKKVLRTWAVRGTLHFVAPGDIRWLLSLVAPFVFAGNARRYRELGLDEETFSRSSAAIREALEGSDGMTRTELKVILQKRGISSVGQRAPYILQRVSLDGLICQTGMVHNQAVFSLLEDVVPASDGRRYPNGRAELARRYFTSRGPATIGDFIWWSGLPAAEAKAGLEAAKHRLGFTTMGKTTYWHDPGLPDSDEPFRSVHLLPTYDEYLIGYRDRSAIFGDANGGTPPESLLSQKIVLRGRVAGTWKRIVKDGTVLIARQLRVPFAGEENDAFMAAVRRYEEFLGVPVANS